MKIRPLSSIDYSSKFRNLIEQTIFEIQALDNEYVLKASLMELEDYYNSKVIIEPLILHVERYYIEKQVGTQIDVSRDVRRVIPGKRAFVQGTRLDIAIPYEGDPRLWDIQPSTFSIGGYPDIEVRDDVVVFSVQFPDDSADDTKLKTVIDAHVNSLSSAVENLKRNVEDHNNSAPQAIKTAIERKRRLAEAAIGAVAALGIPIRRRDEPLTYTVPTIRRKMPIRKPRVPAEAYRPEPVLEETEYQHILEILRSMSLVIERNPKAFSTLDEEAIRTHFLLQLNGHYEGYATGETFNASGKTDIIIRAEDRNIFIAECKFWRGKRAFSEAIDQLLRYLSWRDTKCAILIFNRTKDSSAVRQKMHEVMESRPEYRRTISYDPNGDARYIFVKESDPGREIIITTQLYDIP